MAESLRTDEGQVLAIRQVVLTSLAIFTFFVISGLSPIHARFSATCLALFCILISSVGGIALSFHFGLDWSDIHGILPPILVGIGLQDYYIVCKAIDRTPNEDSPSLRIRKASAWSIPRITMFVAIEVSTLLFAAFVTSVPGLHDFCICVALCILSHYKAVLTLFLPAMLWDLTRMHNRKGDIFMWCCGERFCCNARLLSEKKKDFSGLGPTPAEDLDKDKILALEKAR